LWSPRRDNSPLPTKKSSSDGDGTKNPNHMEREEDVITQFLGDDEPTTIHNREAEMSSSTNNTNNTRSSSINSSSGRGNSENSTSTTVLARREISLLDSLARVSEARMRRRSMTTIQIRNNNETYGMMRKHRSGKKRKRRQLPGAFRFRVLNRSSPTSSAKDLLCTRARIFSLHRKRTDARKAATRRVSHV